VILIVRLFGLTGGNYHGKPAVSRDAFRSFFALYAAKAHHDNKPEGEYRLMNLFGSSENIPDDLLDLWSARG
jgi:hypothetical protein